MSMSEEEAYRRGLEKLGLHKNGPCAGLTVIRDGMARCGACGAPHPQYGSCGCGPSIGTKVYERINGHNFRHQREAEDVRYDDAFAWRVENELPEYYQLQIIGPRPGANIWEIWLAERLHAEGRTLADALHAAVCELGRQE